MDLEKIYKEEDLFPREITSYEKREYGYIKQKKLIQRFVKDYTIQGWTMDVERLKKRYNVYRRVF